MFIYGPGNYKAGAIVSCQQCSKEFITRKEYVRQGRAKFCSMRCRGLYFNQNLLLPQSILPGEKFIQRPGQKERAVDAICLECGSSFLAGAGRVARGRARFCSKPCGMRYTRKTVKPGNSIKSDELYVLRANGDKSRAALSSCAFCNKEYLRAITKMRGKKPMYCSNSCARKAYFENNKSSATTA